VGIQEIDNTKSRLVKKKAKRKSQPTVAELRKVKLDDSNYQCPSNFYDSAWDHPHQTFKDAVRTHRRLYGFRGEKNGAARRQQCLDEWNKYAAIPRPVKKSTE
jgi:hypothetical protein